MDRQINVDRALYLVHAQVSGVIGTGKEMAA
jgi:hypothetical protein